MIEELDKLNRGLEKLVAVRTAALRESEAQLKAQNLRFEAAVNNMSQALLMFDGERRLVICNERYRRMYGLSREVVKPGCTLRGLLEHRKAIGTFAGDIDSYITQMFDDAFGRHNACQAGRAARRAHHRRAQPPDERTAAGSPPTTTSPSASAPKQQIAHMARHDALTDLPNRVLFRERLARGAGRRQPRRASSRCSISISTASRASTTRLAIRSATSCSRRWRERLRHCVRDTDTVARLGGDEFAIIQTGIEQPARCRACWRGGSAKR